MFLTTLYAFVGSFGFGIIFNIKGKNLIIAALGGGLSWLTYQLCINANLSQPTALFIATLIVSTYAEYMAKLMKSPVTIFIICSIVPLVPGSDMYYATNQSVLGNFSESLTLGIETLLKAGAIAVGIILVSSVSRLIKKAKVKFKKVKHVKMKK